MTYQEIKNQLKSLKEQNHIIPALNSKKEVLQAALDQILATIAATAAQAIAETTDQAIAPITVTIAETAPTEITEAVEIVTPATKELDFTTANQYPAFLTALATVFAFLQSLWIKSAPYLEKSLKYVQIVLLPKLALANRFTGLVVLLIVLRVARRWGGTIA